MKIFVSPNSSNIRDAVMLGFEDWAFGLKFCRFLVSNNYKLGGIFHNGWLFACFTFKSSERFCVDKQSVFGVLFAGNSSGRDVIPSEFMHIFTVTEDSFLKKIKYFIFCHVFSNEILVN